MKMSQLSLKHLSKYRDKLNYENEDYELKVLMDKNAHYDAHFQEGGKTHHFDGAQRREEAAHQKRVQVIKNTENLDLPDNKPNQWKSRQFEMKYQGTLNDLLGSKNYVQPKIQALENNFDDMNQQPQGRNRKSLTASQRLDLSSSKDEYFKNVHEIAKQK